MIYFPINKRPRESLSEVLFGVSGHLYIAIQAASPGPPAMAICSELSYSLLCSLVKLPCLGCANCPALSGKSLALSLGNLSSLQGWRFLIFK